MEYIFAPGERVQIAEGPYLRSAVVVRDAMVAPHDSRSASGTEVRFDDDKTRRVLGREIVSPARLPDGFKWAPVRDAVVDISPMDETGLINAIAVQELSLTGLARLLGCPRETVVQWQRGRVRVPQAVVDWLRRRAARDVMDPPPSRVGAASRGGSNGA